MVYGQAKNVTIALAVSSIYAVDFSINVGKLISLLRLASDHCSPFLSTSVLSQSHCGHIADSAATGWICLGYVPVRPLLRSTGF